MAWYACKEACRCSDPASDTVKVDAEALDRLAQKENVPLAEAPRSSKDITQDKKSEKRDQDVLRENEQNRFDELQQEQEAQTRREMEERSAELQREEMEKGRLLLEDQSANEQNPASAEAAAASAAAAERSLAQQQAALEEEEVQQLKQKVQQQRQKREAALEEEERLAAQAKVNAWCKLNGWSDLNAKKKSFMNGTRFPLHEAVSKRNAELVLLMVKAGADRSLKNSKGQTPKELAQKMSKDGSMATILMNLSGNFNAHGVCIAESFPGTKREG
jgi:hypothetical protein